MLDGFRLSMRRWSMTCELRSMTSMLVSTDLMLGHRLRGSHNINQVLLTSFNPLTAKLFNLMFHPLEVVSR